MSIKTKEGRASSIQALKDLIKAMGGLPIDKLDDERFVLIITPYINEAYKILKHDIEG